MKFRPCIDIHNGKVKQIVGGSLTDVADKAEENFISEQDGAFFANFYQKDHLEGGHIILLNPKTSPYYEATRKQAFSALAAWPKGMQIGGGINDENAEEFLNAGASHVIVTSFVFKDGKFNRKNLEKMISCVGKEHLVLDLSCRQREGKYYIVTDRWQNFTNVEINIELLKEFSFFCDEFLIHAVDVEGKKQGIEKELLEMLGKWNENPITYAGGIGNFEDLKQVKLLGKNKVDFTIGSALDLFGGSMPYAQVLKEIVE